MKLKILATWKKINDKPKKHIKNQRHYIATTVHIVKAMVFPVVIYGCENWTIKKAEHQRIHAFNCGVGEESPLDCKEIKRVHPKENQS